MGGFYDLISVVILDYERSGVLQLMAETGSRFKAFVTVIAVLAFAFLSIAFAEASAELRHHKNILRNHGTTEEEEEEKGFRSGYVFQLLNSLLEAGQAVYRHVWPVSSIISSMKFVSLNWFQFCPY